MCLCLITKELTIMKSNKRSQYQVNQKWGPRFSHFRLFVLQNPHLPGAEIDADRRVEWTAAGANLTRIDKTADESVTVEAKLTATLELTRTSHRAVGVLVTWPLSPCATIYRYTTNSQNSYIHIANCNNLFVERYSHCQRTF